MVYTFKNYGSNAYTVLLDFSDYSSNNITTTYKVGNNAYGSSKQGLVVKGVTGSSSTNAEGKRYEESTYYVKLKAEDLAHNASFISGFDWCMEAYYGGNSLSLEATDFTANDDGTYTATYNGGDISVANVKSSEHVSDQSVTIENMWVDPSTFGSDAVTSIARTDKKFPSNTKVVISEGVEDIANLAFYEQSGIVSLTLPSTIKTGKGSFKVCRNLTEIELKTGLTVLPAEIFEHCSSLKNINIPNTVTSMEKSVFYECTSLEEIVIPDSVNYIGIYAFRGCTNLKSVHIGNKVETIDTMAFYKCTSLEEITIPNTVTKLGYGPFEDCTSLKTLVLGAGLTAIDQYTFKNTNLTFVYIHDGLQISLEALPISNATIVCNTYNSAWNLSKPISCGYSLEDLKTPAAKIGNVEYCTLLQTHKRAQDGDVIELLKSEIVYNFHCRENITIISNTEGLY